MSTNAGRAMAAAGIGHNSRRETCATCPFMQQRSEADHGMFWAIIARTFESWPHDHAFCPDNEKELYGWLLVEVGHCVSGEVEDRDINAIRKSARVFMELAGESDHEIHYMRLNATRRGVRITIPKSLKYKLAGKRKFQEVRSKVYDLIETVLGVPVETMKREATKEAA